MKVLGYNGGIGGYIEKFGMGVDAIAAAVKKAAARKA